MLPTPYSQDYLDLSSEIFSNGYGSGLVPFLGDCRGVTVVGGLGWVIPRYWAASLLRLSCCAPAEGSGGVGNEAVRQGCKDGSSFA